jgi:SAM-dependent methyltransferase
MIAKAEPREHMRRKRDAYWTDLVGGVTGRYKTEQVCGLLAGRRLPAGSAVVDVGAGTSGLAKMVAEIGGLQRIICVDYDEAIVRNGRAAETDPRVEWRAADARELASWTDRVGAVTFFDILHELYSFVGRSGDDPAVDHATGRAAVEGALTAAASLLAPGGVIVIADDVLPEEEVTVRVSCRHDEIADLVRRIEREYGSRPLEIRWLDERDFEIPSRTLITLLTHYNKPKVGDEARWAVEQMEVHEYMKVSEYDAFLRSAGLTPSIVVGTPDEALAEWRADFRIVGGLADFPAKRVTVVAVR